MSLEFFAGLGAGLTVAGFAVAYAFERVKRGDAERSYKQAVLDKARAEKELTSVRLQLKISEEELDRVVGRAAASGEPGAMRFDLGRMSEDEDNANPHPRHVPESDEPSAPSIFEHLAK